MRKYEIYIERAIVQGALVSVHASKLSDAIQGALDQVGDDDLFDGYGWRILGHRACKASDPDGPRGITSIADDEFIFDNICVADLQGLECLRHRVDQIDDDYWANKEKREILESLSRLTAIAKDRGYL